MLLSSLLSPLLAPVLGWDQYCVNAAPHLAGWVVTQQVFELKGEASGQSTVVEPIISHTVNPSVRPLLIWHGLGDNYNSSAIGKTIELIQSLHPGIEVFSIYADPDSATDQKLLMFGDANKQIEEVCQRLTEIPSLMEGVDAFGFSQGGLLLRGLAERCPSIKFNNLVTFGSPHMGVQDLPICEHDDWICKKRNALLKSQVWLDRVQHTVLPALYFRDPGQLDQYMFHSYFLADINNELADTFNGSYGERFSQLNRLVLIKFARDTTLVPKESAWFEEIDPVTEEVVPIDQTALFQQDLIGLQQLYNDGKVEFFEVDEDHMSIPHDLLLTLATEYTGGSK